MMFRRALATGAISLFAFAGAAGAQTTLTIATVNNGDMIRMQGLTQDFTDKHPDIALNWVTLEENVLRQRVTTDIATSGGQFDVMTIGTYEVPIWAGNDWLLPLENLGDDYDVDDILPPIREALSADGKLFAAPFYAESAMTLYRTDLFEAAGLEMPEAPTWEFIEQAAKTISEANDDVYGICLRGKPGWGENMAFLGSMARSYGANYFDAAWQPQFDGEGWKTAVDQYVRMLTEYGPPGAASNGFNENLSLFNQGRCAMWMDATVAASFVTDPDESQVAETVGFAPFPCGIENCPNSGANWLWAWSLAIPAGSQKTEAAETFIGWATSKAYLELVAEKEGWASVPPGTRTSLYENEAYTSAAPFAEATLNAIDNADPSIKDDKPYVGLQFAAIPEFQGLGTSVGQQMAAAVSGNMSVEQALSAAQQAATREMTRAGYIK
jgi:sorbitol/mannitol transport system substrate-binding protein